MIDELRSALKSHTDAGEGAGGMYRTGVASLCIIRGDGATALEHVLYDPALIVVVQGSKELLLGDARLRYQAGQYLVLSVGLPVLASIIDADSARPYLALGLTIDLSLINELIDGMGRADDPPAPPHLGLFVGTLDAQQIDPIVRLGRLLGTPDALRMLYPSIAREFFYWTLRGRDGAAIRRLTVPGSHTQRIAKAIHAMRTDSEHIPIERLAAIAELSPSAFHHHFKLVTSMSPLQYHKHLRLLEARRFMLADGADATRAAYHVGYQSASQFSREYARMFGAPPRRDMTAVRTSAGV